MMGNSGSNSTPLSPKTENTLQRNSSITSHPFASSSPSSPPVEPSSPVKQADKNKQETAAGTEPEDGEDEGPCEPPFRSSCLVVMRHGQRLDDIMDDWETSTCRPWDPPLTPHGHKQARQAGRRLQGKCGDRIMHIYSSPFKRCLQTAVGVARANSVEQVSVSFGLCEMLSRIKTAPPDAGRVSDWLWGDVDEGDHNSAWSTAGWRKGGNMTVQGIRIVGIRCTDQGSEEVEGEVDQGSEEVEGEVEEDQEVDPSYPETISDAYGRFDAEFRRLMLQVKDGEVVVAVTHGDAVGRSVAMCEPNAVVYEVSNTGYCCLNAAAEDSRKVDLIDEHGLGYYREADDADF